MKFKSYVIIVDRKNRYYLIIRKHPIMDASMVYSLFDCFAPIELISNYELFNDFTIVTDILTEENL
jgi:hypothetical protein